MYIYLYIYIPLISSFKWSCPLNNTLILLTCISTHQNLNNWNWLFYVGNALMVPTPKCLPIDAPKLYIYIYMNMIHQIKIFRDIKLVFWACKNIEVWMKYQKQQAKKQTTNKKPPKTLYLDCFFISKWWWSIMIVTQVTRQAGWMAG